VLAAAGALTLTGTAPADAGTNGQQIDFFNGASSVARVYGTNQKGVFASTCGQVPSYSYVQVPGYWWVGTVTVLGNDLTSTECNAPRNNPYGNWTYCGNLP
jgi:hypothetical protein